MNQDKVADFLFEIGTLRNMRRMQSQILPEARDTIASHSFEVAVIGMILAHEENADGNKVIRMCLFDYLVYIVMLNYLQLCFDFSKDSIAH